MTERMTEYMGQRWFYRGWLLVWVVPAVVLLS